MESWLVPLRARSQIPVYGLTGLALYGQLVVPGGDFAGKILE